MQEALQLDASHSVDRTERSPFVIDTTIVLFLLALDLGSTVFTTLLEGFIPFLTIAVFVVVPYVLPYAGRRPDFRAWVIGRVCLAVFGILAGLALRRAIGGVLPEYVAHLPMTFLILAAVISCYLQFYAILRFRLAS